MFNFKKQFITKTNSKLKRLTPSEDFKYIQITDYEDLMDECKTYIKDKVELKKIQDAYFFAEEKHINQKRKSGEPFIIHPLSCAYYLAQWKMSADAVIAGLLHDTIEDTKTVQSEINMIFGPEVAMIVEAVTKVSYFTKENRDKIKGSYLKKLFVSMSQDVRVIIVKIADRMHNILTLEFQKPEKQIKIAKETLEIFVPLAARLGLKIAKDLLEDSCFKILNPEGYAKIQEKLDFYKADFKKEMNDIVESINKRIENERSIGNTIVFGRAKTINSIYRKVNFLNKEFDEIYDIMAVRIITENKLDCYRILGIVHEMFVPIFNRFKDYIANPKNNLYQSIHTNVVNKDGNVFEIQIRTFDMNEVAEFGIAAHWKYKEGDKKDNKNLGNSNAEEEKIDMFARLLMLEKTTNATANFDEFDVFHSEEDYMNNSNLSMTQQNDIEEIVLGDYLSGTIFVVTPDQKVWTLPKKSTPIDLAYKIGNDVGNKIAKAKINGQYSQITKTLDSGDVVEIITDPNAKPSRKWLKSVKTVIAKKEIEAYIAVDEQKEREKQEVENMKLIRKVKMNIDDYIAAKKLQNQLCSVDELLSRCQKIGYPSVHAFLLDVGYGAFTIENATRLIYLKESGIKELNNLRSNIKKSEIDALEKNNFVINSTKNDVIIEGMKGMDYVFSSCCMPIPSEDIVAIVYNNEKIYIHKRKCDAVKKSNAINKDEEAIIDAKWDPKNIKNKSYLTQIFILAKDEKTVIDSIYEIIMPREEIVKVALKKYSKAETFGGEITLSINNIEELNVIIELISKNPNIQECSRTDGAIADNQ
ncbi:RelA/SpoT family protein [Spiroplasma endosymbiont of Crioceris asparagi]|uniref:RelA/SpoT family protein n=1 Tax=Spiroplasma endosymbiont of Crioceris asparagi TaxID=3066286 RepID=UPI0030D3BC21